MSHDKIEFHNVAELVPCPHPNGLALYRYPREVIAHLTPLGHHAAACSDGVEMRFVTANDWVSLTLSARSNYCFSQGAQVEIFRGGISVASQTIPDGATQTLKLMAPPLLAQMKAEAFAGTGFTPNLWRGRCAGATVIYHGIDTAGEAIRPPDDGEKPRRRWLAYGSSITNTAPGYVHHAARHLNVDVLNKGMCGSCFCEAEMARYLANCDAWDFATLELGVNMRGSVNSVEFEKRVRHLVSEMRQAALGKPIILITIFPNSDDFAATPTPNTAVNRDFREVLRRVHAELCDPNLHLLEGDKILSNFSGLSADLIHHSADGHQLMGANLARLLEPILLQKQNGEVTP